MPKAKKQTTKTEKPKKKIVKKATKKPIKKISKATTKKKLKKKIPEEHYFVLVSGQRARNIKELADALEYIDHNHFVYHVNKTRNDFSSWIKDIFQEIELAEEIKKAKNREDARLILYKHISHNFW